MEKEHAQPRQGTFPGPLTCCQDPAKTVPASILTRVGVGSQAHTRPSFPPVLSHSKQPRWSCTGQALSLSIALTKGSACANQMVLKARPWQNLIPLLKHTLTF